MAHEYRLETAHVRVQTDYGKFYLCSACYNAGHMQDKFSHLVPFYGDKRDGTPQPKTLQSCTCEHASHMQD